MSVSGGKYRIIAHLRGGDVTEASLVMNDAGPGAGGGLGVMKRLKLGRDAEPQTLARFAEETRLCKRLDHPNLAKLVEAGQDEDGPVLVFEYVEGPSLSRLRSRAGRKGGGFPLPLALHIVREIAKGLAYAHTLVDEGGKPLKIVHRDVSPDNVTVTYDGDVKLADFGMASSVAITATSRENRVKGNVAYMAPEQLRAEFALDPRADLFALGVIMWELLAGKRLWEGLSEVDVLARLGDDNKLPSVRGVAPLIPEAIDAIVAQSLSKVRDERFDSAEDFLAALDKVLKRPELKATPGDLGAFVTTQFADERTKMRQVIAEASRASVADSERALPVIGTPRAPDASPLVDQESDPRLRFGVTGPEEPPVRRVVEIIKIEPASDHRFAYIMAAVGVLIVGTLAVVAVTSSREEIAKPASRPYEAPTRPQAPTAEPAPTGPLDPKEVAVDITVTPLDAKLFVDGVRTKNPYHTRVAPASFRHSIRAEAEGFEPRTMTVVFDRERVMEISLTPVPKRPVWRPAAPAPASAAPPPPPASVTPPPPPPPPTN